MHSHLVVRWRLAPAGVPRVLRHCPRCEADRWFVSSGRFRVNAQKKKLDAWLIYGCGLCGRTWNLPVFERLHVREVDPVLLERLHGNCAVLAAEWGSDLELLGRYVRAVEPTVAAVVKEAFEGSADATSLCIAIERNAQRVRLDRLLAAALGRSRSCIARWEVQGVLVATPSHRFAQNGQVVRLELCSLTEMERAAVIRRATGDI